MNALEKIKLSRESLNLVGQLTSGELKALEKVNAAKRVVEITTLLGGTVAANDLTKNGLSDNPNDANYRWADTGYVAGSRKELASLFSDARKSGQNIVVNDVDWDELKADPRLAQTLITKQNVIGRVDYVGLRELEMPSEVAYFIKRIYAAISKAPINPLNSESQRNYVQAISTFRENMEKCRSYDDVKDYIIAVSKQLISTKLMMAYYEVGLDALPERQRNSNLAIMDCRVLSELGDTFYSWIYKTGNKALHELKTGRVPSTSKPSVGANWDWLDKEPKTTEAGEAKPKKSRFQLEAASNIERVGGTQIKIESAKQLEQMFGFRAIQSGNWVLKDKESAEYHMQAAGEAMLDMSDILGIDAKALGLNGNLALAFGARGKGGALAHYEPSSKVINITKMKGGGSLGHEYFHALDNLIKDLSTQEVGDVGFMGTSNPDKLPDQDLAKVFKGLQGKLLKHNDRMVWKPNDTGAFEGFNKDDPSAKHKDLLASGYSTLDYRLEEAGLPALKPTDDFEKILSSFKKIVSDLLANNYRNTYALQLLPRMFGSFLFDRHWQLGEKSDVKFTPDNQVYIEIAGFTSNSDFMQQAILLDDFKVGKYWSKDYEMAARAFSAYLQDKLDEKGRKNDYLAYSTKGGNSRVGEIAYPQGNERKQINAAFDELFAVIREKKVLETAANNYALMDSLFGVQDLIVLDDACFDSLSFEPQNDGFLVWATQQPYFLSRKHDDVRGEIERGAARYFKKSDIRQSYFQYSDIDKLAHEAATSPYNELSHLTDDEKLSGQYQKGQFKLMGFDVSIENPAGSVRTGIDANGEKWENEIFHHYGYLDHSVGADGDELDVFVKTGTLSDWTGDVFVIDQLNPDQSFDEHKVILGADSAQDAKDIYMINYEKGWGGLGAMVQLTSAQFTDWFNSKEPKTQKISELFANQVFELEFEPLAS